MRSDPAYSIIRNLGGVSSVADTLGVARQTVWKWTTPKGRSGGTGGLIPLRYHIPLLQLAIRKNKPLTAADFLPGQKPFGGEASDYQARKRRGPSSQISNTGIRG